MPEQQNIESSNLASENQVLSKSFEHEGASDLVKLS